MELPELPERYGTRLGGWAGDIQIVHVYTADQMREYAKAAVLAERERYEPLIAMLEEAESPYMEGIHLDVEWLARRDALVSAIRQQKE